MKFLTRDQIDDLCVNQDIRKGYEEFKKQVKFKVSIIDLYCMCHFRSGEVDVFVKYYLHNSNKVLVFEYTVE